MRYHLPNTNEQPVTPDDAEHEARLVARGWVAIPEPPTSEPEPISEVATWALREACMIAGYNGQIEAAIAALPTPQRLVATNRWEYKTSIRRQDPLIQALILILGWTTEQADALFQQANEIQNS
jgi:hypothetical protein